MPLWNHCSILIIMLIFVFWWYLFGFCCCCCSLQTAFCKLFYFWLCFFVLKCLHGLVQVEHCCLFLCVSTSDCLRCYFYFCHSRSIHLRSVDELLFKLVWCVALSRSFVIEICGLWTKPTGGLVDSTDISWIFSHLYFALCELSESLMLLLRCALKIFSALSLHKI